MIISLAMEQVGKYYLHITKAFEGSGKALVILEFSLKKVKDGREKVIEFIDQGMSHEEAINKFY